MTIDEQVSEYMSGWFSGVNCAQDAEQSHYPEPKDDYERGYASGRAAYLAAERAERERLGQCSQCTGRGGWINALDGLMQQCPTCHGTGRRT